MSDIQGVIRALPDTSRAVDAGMQRRNGGIMKKFMKSKPVLLALALLLGLSGCGRKEDGAGGAVKASKDYVYRATESGLKNEDDQSISQIFRAGDAIYAYGSHWTDDGNVILTFYEIRQDGTVGEMYEIPGGANTSFTRISMDEEANLYCVKNIYYAPPASEDVGIMPLDGEDLLRSAVAEVEPVSGDVQESADGDIVGADNAGADDAGAGISGAGDAETESDGAEAGKAAQSDTSGEEGAERDSDTDADADESGEEGSDAADEEDPVTDDASGEEYTDDYYLVKMTLQGEELFSVKLNDVPELKAIAEENGYFYVGDMYLNPGKGIYFNVYNQFIKFDLEGNFEKRLTKSGEENPFQDVSNLITLEDGRMVALLYEENGMSLAQADLEAGTLGEKYTLPGRTYDYSYFPGIGYDLYVTSTYGLYGYNLGDEDKTPIMSFMDSDFSFYGIYQVTSLNEQEFVAITNDWESGDTLMKFTKVDPKDVKEKQIITLAMPSTDWDVRRLAILFNRSNENYRISIQDYESMYAVDGDWSAGLNRLNTDIVSGKVPDIILLNTSLPVDSYISKGLFEDLKPFIEKDEAFALEDFMPNIVEAFSVDGELYILVPSYSIDTLVAKTSDVGKERGWTVQEVQELLASRPEGTQFLVNATRNDVMQHCISLAGSQFIDWESGTCNFNSDAFIQMLEFVGSFPEEVNWENLPDEFWDNYDSMWRDGRAIAQMSNVGDLRNFNSMEKGSFGEEITMIGFPSADGDGSAIWPSLQFALSAKSRVKDGAWEFLRTFLMDEYQEKIEYSFPLSIEQLNTRVEEAMKRPYYMDENNQKVEYDETAYIGGVEIPITPITRERADEIVEQLYSFTQVYRLDETLLNIIQEEAAPYFAGQKNAKEVASIIQSRVQIYVNENR